MDDCSINSSPAKKRPKSAVLVRPSHQKRLLQNSSNMVSSIIKYEKDEDTRPSPASYDNVINTIGRRIHVSSLLNSPAFTFIKDKKMKLSQTCNMLYITPEKIKLLKRFPKYSFSNDKRFHKICTSQSYREQL